jgi:hypothetical protein
MDLAYKALDFYSNALTTGKRLKDPEIIAEAMAKTGKVYFRVIKNSDKARAILHDVIAMCHKEEHAHLTVTNWFIEARKNLSEIQSIKGDAHLDFRRKWGPDIEKVSA